MAKATTASTASKSPKLPAKRSYHKSPFGRAKGKHFGLSVSQTWVRVFTAQPKARLSDAQITALMVKEFGQNRPSFARVQHERRNWNRGYYSPTGKAPKAQLVPVTAS